MIRPRMAERVIKSAGGMQKAKAILDGVPDSTANVYSIHHGLYLRKTMSHFGLAYEAYLSAGGWLFITGLSKSSLIKLSELRRAVALVEGKDKLSHAANDCIEQVFSSSSAMVAKFNIGDEVVHQCLLKSDAVHTVSSIRKSKSKGIGYLIECPDGKQCQVSELHIRKAMQQESITGQRISSLDDALTVTELNALCASSGDQDA